MKLEIHGFEPSRVGDAVAVYNRLTLCTPFCYPITAEIFAEAVARRKEFDPAGFLIAYADGQPVGLIHAWLFERRGAKGGSILLFLAVERLVCRRLLSAALDYLRRRGAQVCEVMGNAPGTRMFYAGIHMGYEVSLWRGYYAAVNALEHEGFDLVCEGFIMSKTLAQEPEVEPPVAEVTLRLKPGEDTGPFYTQAAVEAYAGEENIGACHYHFLKRLSAHLGKGIGQITISLSEKYHRRRIGSALLSRAHQELYRMGVRTVILATNYELYLAIRMYEKLGYRKELIDLWVFAKYFDEA